MLSPPRKLSNDRFSSISTTMVSIAASDALAIPSAGGCGPPAQRFDIGPHAPAAVASAPRPRPALSASRRLKRLSGGCCLLLLLLDKTSGLPAGCARAFGEDKHSGPHRRAQAEPRAFSDSASPRRFCGRVRRQSGGQ